MGDRDGQQTLQSSNPRPRTKQPTLRAHQAGRGHHDGPTATSPGPALNDDVITAKKGEARHGTANRPLAVLGGRTGGRSQTGALQGQ